MDRKTGIMTWKSRNLGNSSFWGSCKIKCKRMMKQSLPKDFWERVNISSGTKIKIEFGVIVNPIIQAATKITNSLKISIENLADKKQLITYISPFSSAGIEKITQALDGYHER